MLWRLQTGVCVLLMCVCVCSSAPCPGGRPCGELISQEALLTCLRTCALERLTPDSASSAEPPARSAPPLARGDAAREEEDEEGERSAAPSAERRGYAMDHFRWGKPAGRKRRPIKAHASGGGVADAGGENRRSLGAPGEEEEEEDEDEEEGEGDGGVEVRPRPARLLYRMSHFRWGRPPLDPPTPASLALIGSADKRYGGFMKPWTAAVQPSSHKPLLTLFRHAIARDGH